jgi:hypothetical protein
MSKFYEIEIQTSQEDQESKGIYTYNTADDAEIVFHQKMASGMTAIKAGTLKKVLNLVIDDLGNPLFRENKESAVEPNENEAEE